MSSLNNLAITATNSAMTSAMGAMFNTLQSKIANGGRDRNCKFYYNDGAGGSILQVAVKGAVGGVVSELKDEAVNAFNSLLNGKRTKSNIGSAWTESELKKQEEEAKEYGMMQVDGGTIYALDDWGCKAPEALMLGIELDQSITVTQNFPVYRTQVIDAKKGIYKEQEPNTINNVVTTKTLVWYDTTALVTINSDKNLIATRVQGRDYSRKELVSNGDIKFSVSGQITSGKPDIYPSEEVKKFIKVMQYKGIVKINNQILDQFGISHIVITNFNISPRQGYKALQQYSFSAIGLQPEKDIEISEDTISIIPQKVVADKEDDGSEWMKMLNNQLEGLKSMAADVFSQGVGLAAGMLENKL
jgi:hypothetical protein